MIKPISSATGPIINVVDFVKNMEAVYPPYFTFRGIFPRKYDNCAVVIQNSGLCERLHKSDYSISVFRIFFFDSFIQILLFRFFYSDSLIQILLAALFSWIFCLLF